MRFKKRLIIYLLFGILILPSAFALNTSIKGFKDTMLDFNFSSTTYVLAHVTYFNTTATNSNFTFLSSFNVKKETIGTTNQISVRIRIDGVVIVDEVVRTVESIDDEGSTGTRPVMFNLSAGQHNMTFEVKKTGLGVVSINDADLVFLQMYTTQNGTVYGQITNSTYTHSSTTFIPAFNWTANKQIDSPTFTTLKQTINGTFITQATTEYRIKNLADNHTSPYWSRFLQNTADRGSMSMSWIDEDQNVNSNMTIMSRTFQSGLSSSPTIFSNASIFNMDLKDNSSNLIPSFSTTNNQTNLTRYLNFTGPGTFNILNKTVTIYNGTAIFLAMSTTFSPATGAAHTPVYFINSSEVPQSNCYSKKERHIESANDVGNAFIYTICTNLTAGNSYTFNLWLDIKDTGDREEQLDESFVGFEVTLLNTSDAPLPPIPTEITNPANGSCNNGTINITWLAFTDPEGNNVTYNVTLYNTTSGIYNKTINNTNLTYQLFDTTTVNDGNWTIYVEGCDTLGLCANTSVSFTIDNTKPSVTPLAPPLNSSFNFGSSIEIAALVTDNCCVSTVKANITYPDSTSTLLNLAAQTGGKYNTSFTIPSINGRYNVTFFANDSCNNINNTETTYFNTINISLEKTDNPHPVDPGAQLNYTLIIRNSGSGTAYNITVKEYYPGNVTFHNSSPVTTSGNDTWFFSNLTNGTIIYINITINVSAGLPAGWLLNNTINVTYEDSNGTNTTKTHSLQTAISGEVAIVAEKTASPNPVAPGANLTYVINVTNIGNVIAYNVTVTETESDDLTYLSAEPTPNSTNPYTWIIPQLNEDVPFLINITKQVNSSITNGTIVNNTANITYNNTLITTVNTSTDVSPMPYLVITKTSSPDPVTAGNQLNYTITITNTGGAPAENVVVTETYPAGTSFDSSTPSPTSGNNTWNLGTIENGTSTTINITVNVSSSTSGTIINTVNTTYYNRPTGENITVITNESTTVNPPTPPPPSGPGSGGGGSKAYKVEQPCINGTYITEGTMTYGPICCDDSYCKLSGEKWYCAIVEGKTFSICKLPTETRTPEQPKTPPSEATEETSEETPQPFKEKSPETSPLLFIEREDTSTNKILIAAIGIILAVIGIVMYLSYRK